MSKDDMAAQGSLDHGVSRQTVVSYGAGTNSTATFLLADTPRFEECNYAEAELAAMSDADLMSAAYSAWADYARCMY